MSTSPLSPQADLCHFLIRRRRFSLGFSPPEAVVVEDVSRKEMTC